VANITHYDIGDVWAPQATFKVGGTNTDPTTVTARVKEPDGTITTLGPVSGATGGSGITRVSAGVYTVPLTLDTAGYWSVRIEGSGAAAGAAEHQAVADPSEFFGDSGLSARALVGLRETKDWLQRNNIDASDDTELVRVINDISDRFHQEAEREFKPPVATPETRVFPVLTYSRSDPYYVDGDYLGDRSRRRRTIEVGDLADLDAVTILDYDWTSTLESVALADVTAHPMVRQPWEPIRWLEFQTDVTSLGNGMRVSVTGTWGFPAVPGNVRQAVLDAVAAVMDRDVEHYRQDNAPAAGAAEGGTVVVVGGGGGRLLSLPPSAQAVAWSYRESRLG
jgi:hypothetical protein